MRCVRIPFSVYYKPLQQQAILGREAVECIPQLFLIPLGQMDTHEGLLAMRDVGKVKELAKSTSTRIPEQSAGMLKLIENYRQSGLAQIHRWFYSQEHHPPERWERTYDATSLDLLPPSGRQILEAPNDLLLKPACLRHLVRLFLALGWHPRHIAGLVRSKYERDHGWGYEWYSYDAATRADFYCRLFTGLIVARIDELADFRCPPVGALMALAQEGREDFEPYRESLKRRLNYDRLARRPFHRLFL